MLWWKRPCPERFLHLSRTEIYKMRQLFKDACITSWFMRATTNGFWLPSQLTCSEITIKITILRKEDVQTKDMVKLLGSYSQDSLQKALRFPWKEYSGILESFTVVHDIIVHRFQIKALTVTAIRASSPNSTLASWKLARLGRSAVYCMYKCQRRWLLEDEMTIEQEVTGQRWRKLYCTNYPLIYNTVSINCRKRSWTWPLSIILLFESK